MDASFAITFVVAILTQEVAAGNYEVLVDRLIQECIDTLGMELVEQQLSVNMGRDFDILRDPASNLLHVQVRESQPQFSMQHGVESFQPATLQQTTATSPAAGRTKPPRPANKFIMYRRVQHKMFKELNPDLSCIQISKLVGEAWKNLDKAGKAYWDEQYQLELINHERKYPGYKYQPRKPGQKKRRQSRKAMQAAATADATATAAAFEAEILDFDSPMDSSTTSSNPTLTVEDGTQDVSSANIDNTFNTWTLTSDLNPTAQDGTSTNIEDTFSTHGSQLGDIFFPAIDFFEPMSAEFLHGAEMFRQHRLEAEFGSPPATDLDAEATLIFRESADEDAALLSFWDPVF